MFTNSPCSLTFCRRYKKRLVLIKQSIHGKVSSHQYVLLALREHKLQMCSVTQHQCRRHQMCGKCSHINLNTLTIWTATYKMTYLHWTIYSWQGFNSLECPVMLKTNYRCVQSLNISVDVSKCVENVHKFTQFTHFCPLQKKDLSWFNHLFMAAKCVENLHKFTQYTHFLSVTKKRLVLPKQSIHGKLSTH